MAGPRQNVCVQLPNATPVVVDTSNMDESLVFAVSPGSGTDTVKIELSFSPNAAASGPNVTWQVMVATGLTAGVTAAGAAWYSFLGFCPQAVRVTRTAGTGVSQFEINS
jgi:hypothetical protein